MAQEIERRFLVSRLPTLPGSGVGIHQVYLRADPAASIRVRICNDARATLTIKGAGSGAARDEFEYPLPLADAWAICRLGVGVPIDKTRCQLTYHDTTWEIDVFSGVNDGLIVAEVELDAIDQPLALPAWVGREVTAEPEYRNASLALRPYSSWPSPPD
jgi:adenylate cyclase